MRLFRRFFSRWQNWLGLLMVAGFIFVAISAPLLSPNNPENPGPFKVVGSIYDFEPQAPNPEEPLGTLPGQVSVYHALIWGTRSALFFGLLVSVISGIIGVLIGTISAYAGGFLNNFLMRVSDAFLAFPTIAAVVLIQQVVYIILTSMGIIYTPAGSGGIFTQSSVSGNYSFPENLSPFLVLLKKTDPVMIAFILFSWVPYARVMNTVVLRVKRLEYVEAAQSMGVKKMRIIFKHLIPNSIASAIILAARDVGGVVVLQSTFTFIGLGNGSPWATVLVAGRNWIYSPGGILNYWWVFLPATLAIVLFGIGWNLLGDGLNDSLNPRSL
jgi:peptide/nickel transport system permease protein